MKFNIWEDYEYMDLPSVLSFIVDNRGKTVPTDENGNHILIATNCIRNEHLYPLYEKIRFLNEDTYQTWFRAHPLPGDIIFVNKGTPGRVCLVPDPVDFCIAQDMMAFRVNSEIVYNKYLLAVLRSEKIQNQINATTVGDVIPHFKKQHLHEIKIPIPPMSIQKMIGDYYFLFCEKKVLSEKINRNLQEQLKAIFDAWFYKMEPFGGEEPKGTEYIPLEKLCVAVTKGTTPTTLGMSFTDEGINFIKGETILDNHGFDRSKLSFISEDTHEKLKRSQIENGDIVFTIAGTLGRFALVDESMIPANTNQAVAIIRSKCIAPEYLYSFFLGNWHNDYYTKRIQQAVQANLSLGTIKSLPIAVLPKVYYKEYLDIIKPLIRETKRIEAENMKLIELRDSLLPRLMSGELDVSDLDI